MHFKTHKTTVYLVTTEGECLEAGGAESKMLVFPLPNVWSMVHRLAIFVQGYRVSSVWIQRLALKNKTKQNITFRLMLCILYTRDAQQHYPVTKILFLLQCLGK